MQGSNEQFKVDPCTFCNDLDHAPIREVARVAGDAQPTGFLDDEGPVPDPLDTSVYNCFKPVWPDDGILAGHDANSSKLPRHPVIT